MSAATADSVAVTSGAGTADASRRSALVWALSALYAAVFFAGAAANYRFYFAPRFDLGNMVQVVWSTAHGQFLQMSDPNGIEMSRLGAHFDPFLVFLVPIWWIWPSPFALLAAQALAVASGALPVYWLAQKHLGRTGFAVTFAAAYLLYVPTQFNAFTPFGVHAVSFATPLILYAVWFLDEGRLLPFAFVAVVAATTKEEIGAALAGLGFWYAVRHRRRGAGAVIAAAGLAVSVIAFEVVIPHYAENNGLPYAFRYTAVGGTPTGMLHVLVTDPGAFIHQLATWRHLGYLLLIFGPFLGLWALEPILLVGAVPDLAINLLSSNPGQTNIFGHYTAGIIPFVVAASIFGAAKLRKMRYVPPALLGVACGLALISPLWSTVRMFDSSLQREVSAARQAAQMIPAAAPISASRSLGGSLSTRHVLATFPYVTRAEWVVVGPISPFDNKRAVRRRLARIRTSRDWVRVFDSSGIEVFRRRAG